MFNINVESTILQKLRITRIRQFSLCQDQNRISPWRRSGAEILNQQKLDKILEK